MSIMIEVSYGELFDKISILKIKAEKMSDPVKRTNVVHELKKLEDARQALDASDWIENLSGELRRVNETLWDVEDRLRDKERIKLFDDEFVELARSVYKLNDERARIKQMLNIRLASGIVEEKNYRPY